MLIIPYSMAGPARDVSDQQVRGARADGDAVVAGGDPRVDDRDFRRLLHVDSVGVGAVLWRRYIHVREVHIPASIDGDMELLTV